MVFGYKQQILPQKPNKYRAIRRGPTVKQAVSDAYLSLGHRLKLPCASACGWYKGQWPGSWEPSPALWREDVSLVGNVSGWPKSCLGEELSRPAVAGCPSRKPQRRGFCHRGTSVPTLSKPPTTAEGLKSAALSCLPLLACAVGSGEGFPTFLRLESSLPVWS